MLKKTILPLSIIIVSIAGALFSYILAEEYHFINLPQIEGSTPGFFTHVSTQVCGDESSYFSCVNVSKSPYSSVMGFPVALYGVCFYLLTLFTAVGLWFSSRRIRPPIAVFLFWSVTFAMLVDIVLVVISTVYIKSICPFCLMSYGATLLIFGIVLIHLIKGRINPFRIFALFKSLSHHPIGRWADILFVAALAIVLLASAGISYDINTFLINRKTDFINSTKDNQIHQIVAQFVKQPKEDIDPTALYVYGDPKAPVTIIEFSDFLCPFCAYISGIMDELVKENPGKVKVLFVNFPLDITCNRFMPRAMHKGSCALAKGAICADQQNALAAYQKAAFAARENGLTPEDFKTIPIQSGVAIDQFYQCISDPSTLETVKTQIEQANSIGIHATPTLFINKKRYQGKLYKEALQQIIDLEAEAVEKTASQQ